MSRIVAIKNSINRATHFRRGNGISRVYHNLQNLCTVRSTCASVEMFLAMIAASRKNLLNTVLIGGLTLFFTRKAIKSYEMKTFLQESYQEIVDRAKRIYKH